MGFSIIPFLVFDLREKIYLSITSAYMIGVLVFGTEWLINNLNKEIDVSIIVDGPLGPLNIFMGVGFMILGVLVLSFENYKSEKKSISLMSEMDLKTKEIKNSENELKNKIAQIEINQAEEKKRNWATVGVAEVSTLLRSDRDSQMLYDKITSYISEYMGANQCALFLVEKDEYDEEVILKLHSCYAYDRKKYFDKDIKPGQGQIGQAYLERTTIYLKDVPEGYANITSGMGNSTAKEVLIVPLVVNEQVEGIFEFASFKKFEEYQVSFIEQLGETLAAFININRINERTKLLLEESQQQGEEMRSQEEEMRQNMEELSATQEEMGRKEQGYVDQIKELTQEIKFLKTGVNS
jgi:transcriptional regulator with GAF, ATPase, and Fis domain